MFYSSNTRLCIGVFQCIKIVYPAVVKNPPANAGNAGSVWSLSQEDLE